MKSQSIFSASRTSSCFMLMICSSLARNRSAEPVVSCFLGRIVPSDAATESRLPIRGNPENEIARFRGFRPENLAISNPPNRPKMTPGQRVGCCSRPTNYRRDVLRGRKRLNDVEREGCAMRGFRTARAHEDGELANL